MSYSNRYGNSAGGGGSSGGIGFVGALQIAFIVLKLCKVISWSWVWVLAPTWISALVILLAFIVIVLCEFLRK